MGRTQTLKVIMEVVSRHGFNTDSTVMLFTNESYLTHRSFFDRLFPGISRSVSEKMLENDERSYLVFADYPLRAVKQDLEVTTRVLMKLSGYANISVVFSMTTSQFASLEAGNIFLDQYKRFDLIPLRKEEISMVIHKRMIPASKITGEKAFVPNARKSYQQFGHNGVDFRVSRDIEITRETLEYIHGISGGNPRLALITAQTLYDKARDNNCIIIDDALIRLVSAQNGYSF